MEAEKGQKVNCRFFILSDAEITKQHPEDIYDVPVDLSKLQRKSMNFTVFIIKEFALQLGQLDETFIITNKKENPIKDISNTRSN